MALNLQLSDLTKQQSTIQQTRDQNATTQTKEIQRTDCHIVGSPGTRGYSVCREVPIFSTTYRPEDVAALESVTNQISGVQGQIKNITDSITQSFNKITAPMGNAPNVSSIGIPAVIIGLGLVAFLILRR